MSKVQVFIDGKPVIADTEQTILQVCREQGIFIPTLCHDDQLEPFTSCFVCVVAVEGARTLVPSCGTKINPGMRITTQNAEIHEARKMALELLLSNHYADCLGPCKVTCPAGVDVQGYVALAAMGKYREAVALIKQANPFPTVCGRVCTRPCETECRRNLVDDHVAIDHVKRFVADFDLNSPDRYFPHVAPDTGCKVAIVGAGPSGLSCAYYLRTRGHHVDVFESNCKAGGMLRWGIPQYRLPQDVLDKEIEGITGLGVEILCDQTLGRDFTLETLLDDDYEAVYLGLGAQSSTSMRVENEDAEGVLSGIDLLEDVKQGKVTALEGKVAVIGGGNTAMDAARTSLRLGAAEVSIVYRRTVKEMPANEMEIEEGEEEGIDFVFLTSPVKVVTNDAGRVTGIECVKMELGEPDASGRRRPIPIEGSNYVIDVDWVIAAIGQRADLSFMTADEDLKGMKTSRWGTIEVNAETMETNIPGVFSGGDVVRGPGAAIEAIADGRAAALAIHEYLTGERIRPAQEPFVSRKDTLSKPTADDFANTAKAPLQKMPVRDPEERKHTWDEIELGFSEEQVGAESLRCLECGCQSFFDCDLQRYSTDYAAEQDNFAGEYYDGDVDDSHPFIRIDLNKCILCGRCVRICDEVMGLGVYGFVNRGFDAKVKPALEVPLAESHCISCGQCIETCPTGALTDVPDAVKPGPWVTESAPTICQYCSVGCTMQAEMLEDRVVKVTADKEAVVNDFGNLCMKGRYGFRYINDAARLRAPMIRKNGALEEVDWDEAFDFVVDKIDELQGQDAAWAVYGSPHVTNEENYLLQKFARVALGTNNIGSFAYLDELPDDLLRATMSNTTFDSIADSDCAVVFNFDPLESHPVLYIELQKAARRGQAVYVLGGANSRLARKANSLNVPDDKQVLFLQYLIDTINHRGDSKAAGRAQQEALAELLKNIAGLSERIELSEFGITPQEFAAFYATLTNARKPLFICDRQTVAPEVIHWLNSLAFVLGQSESFLAVSDACNFQGMMDMGVLPAYLPAYQPVDNSQVMQRFAQKWEMELPMQPGLTPWNSYEKINAGEIKGMIFWAQDPVVTANLPLNRAADSFMVVADMFMTETAQAADVVFPLVPFLESDGSITNAELRIQEFLAVTAPLTAWENWEILAELGARLGYVMDYCCAWDVLQEIVEVVPEYQKEFAVFRNGYLPRANVLEETRSRRVPHGANYLQKWFADFWKSVDGRQ